MNTALQYKLLIFTNRCLNWVKYDLFPFAYIVDDGMETESNTRIIFKKLSRKKRTNKQKDDR